MTCDEIRAMLDREGGLTTGEAQDHVHQCPACQEAWARWQAVQRELRAMGDEETPPFLHSRLMAHVQSAAAQESRSGTWLFGLKKIWAGPVVVLFIGLLLGGFGLLQILKPRAPAPAASVAQTRSRSEAKRFPAESARDEAKEVAKTGEHPAFKAPGPSAPEEAKAAPRTKPVPEAAGGPKPAETSSLFAPNPSGEAAPPESYRPLSNRTVEPPSREGGGESLADPGADRLSSSQRAEMAAPQSEEQAPAEVVCTLSPLSGPGPFISLQLPAEAAPPSGGVWTLILSPGGGLRVQDVQGKAVSEPGKILMEVLHPLHVPPGSYRLKRIS